MKKNHSISCKDRSSIIGKNSTAGITLIALVVTIVVLLILAGVTITIMFGENSIFDTAKDASIKAKLGELEDKAGVIYSNLVTKKYEQNSNKEITTSDIANGLREEDYEIKEIPLVENAIKGIEIAELTNGKIILISDETKELTIKPITSEGGYAYYAVIEGKNYEIKLENGKLKVSRKPQEVEGGEPTKAELKIEIIEGTTVTASKKENEEKVVVLQAGGTAGSTRIKVTYGGKPLEFTAEVEIKPPANAEEDIEGVTFKTDFGKIDIIWLDGTTNNPSSTQTPNSPANYLNGMQPVRWEGTVKDDTITATDTSWYNYEPETGTTDNTSSHWANAKTTNGSYFVWIPRYAYRITYYDKDPNTNADTAQITGYYDGYGMWRASDGALKCKLETQKDASGNEVKDKDGNSISLVETVTYNGEKYIVHPAFTTNLDMGGWSTNLPGFWFAKFEMSGDGSSTTSLKSTQNSNSYVSQTIGKFYTDARSATYGMTGTQDPDDNNTTSFMYSHMAKNSEWGAVAYLTHSKYGRNGYEIGFNTGNGTKSAAITSTDQSTTGNAYGVYDMRGGTYEYVAAFNKNGGSNLTNGNSFTSTKTSTKYATAYNGTTANSGSPYVYNVCKTGDGIKEVYVSGTASWHSDYSCCISTNGSFFERGGFYGHTGADAGVFYSNDYGGYRSSSTGFRTVLCP